MNLTLQGTNPYIPWEKENHRLIPVSRGKGCQYGACNIATSDCCIENRQWQTAASTSFWSKEIKRSLLTAESSHSASHDSNLRPSRPTRCLGTRLADLQLPFADTCTFCGLVKGVVVVGGAAIFPMVSRMTPFKMHWSHYIRESMLKHVNFGMFHWVAYWGNTFQHDHWCSGCPCCLSLMSYVKNHGNWLSLERVVSQELLFQSSSGFCCATKINAVCNLHWMEVLEDASDSTIEFIHLLGDTGSWLGAATWNKFS